MGDALETVEECEVLIDHPTMTTNVGAYSYRIERNGNRSSYSVTDGVKTVTMPIRWAMGASSAIGQTYILEKDGQLYESRVSYFRDLNGLGPTLGSAGSVPADVDEAAGRLMSRDDKIKCFGCHSTNAKEGKQLTLDKLVPGVQCGHCHEGVEAHLAATLVNGYDAEVPKELSKLHEMSAEQAANFCGQCHRTWAEIAMQGNPSIANIRFQPYRLTGSKCYDPDDKRLSCLACHDPHHEVDGKITDYDAKCHACHGGGKAGAKACPVAKDQCASCHMPKLELPGAHFKFSDHRIRIVKANEPYPG
jgi:Cytochrome c554 and c-prime